MAEARVPASVALSLGFHGAALLAFGLLMREGPKQAVQMVEGVDLLIPRAAPSEQPAAAKPPPLSTMDFLKLALPTRPRAASLASVEVKTERKAVLADAPKLEDGARKDLPKLQALDLSNRPAEAAKLDVKISRRDAAATLAALPRLEEVGQRRVKNLPQAIALEESRREAVALGGMPALSGAAPSRRQAVAAAAALQEAAPAASSRPGLGSSLLPERPLLAERAAPMGAVRAEKVAAVAPAAARGPALQATAPSKKGVEIEGPLADRKVTGYSVPPFPDWARAQGILGADVSIRFTVDEAGAVMPGMQVTATSGYGRLDKLAMDALKSWRFAPAPGAGVQWGVITFRFVLE